MIGRRYRVCTTRFKPRDNFALIPRYNPFRIRAGQGRVPKGIPAIPFDLKSVIHLGNMHKNMCIGDMDITWREEKRQSNIEKHGLDFAHAYKVFEGATFTFEDNRFDYGEQRFVTVGVLEGVVVIVPTESETEIRIISMRKATKNEQELYFRNLYG